MYTESYCIALGHNLVGLWFLIAHQGICQGHVGVLCMVVCTEDLWYVLWLWFLAVLGGLLLLWIMFEVIYLVLSG